MVGGCCRDQWSFSVYYPCAVCYPIPSFWSSTEDEAHPAGMSTSSDAKDGSKRNSLEPDVEHTHRAPGAEQGGISPPQVKLKDRQKFFEEAFQQDMEQYLSTGYLQIAERRGEELESLFQEPLSGALRIPAA